MENDFAQKYGALLAILLVAVGVFFRANCATVYADVKPVAADAVSQSEVSIPNVADIEIFFNHNQPISLVPALAFKPVSEEPVASSLVTTDSKTDPKDILESLEPSELAEVYTHFIQRDNYLLNKEAVWQISCAYAEEEFNYGFPRGLLPAIGSHESHQRSNVVSPCGSHGIMQVRVPTAFDAAKRLGKIPSKTPDKEWPKFTARLIKLLKDPKSNIELGANTLHKYLKESRGNLKLALARYSNGASNYSGPIIGRMNAIQAKIIK